MSKILKRKEKSKGNQGDARLKLVVRVASLQDDQNLYKSRSSMMKELSNKAAAARAQISTQNVQESLIANIRIDEEALQAGITRLFPPEENQLDSSSLKMDDQHHQVKDSLMKISLGNGVNEEYDLEFGYEDLDLLVSDSDLLQDGDPLMTKPQAGVNESLNIQCNVFMLPTEFKKSKDQPRFQ